MEQDVNCYYCRKQVKGRPFVPVHSTSPYHWKCYINKIKEEKNPSSVIEVPVEEESKAVEEVIEDET